MKIKVTRKYTAFRDITDDERMQAYLRRALHRSSVKEDKFLFHYSSIDNIVNIVKSQYLWLASSSNMNDLFEGDLLKDKEGYLFFSSFSKAEESLALYDKYCKDVKSGALLKISFSDMEKIIDYSEFGEEQNCVSTLGKYNHTRRYFKVVKNRELMDETVYGDIFCGTVAYFDPVRKVLLCGNEKNNNFESPFLCDELLGFVKYQCWEYEKEVRLYIDLEKKLDDGDCIAVPLPKNVMMNLEVITSPYFDKKKNRKQLSVLRKYGINPKNSLYEGCI